MKKYYQKTNGQLHESFFDKLKVAHLKESNTKAFVCFYSEMEFDIPIGSPFNYIEIEDKTFPIDGKLVYITQSWSLPFDAIPSGHKTVCFIQFSKIYDFWGKMPFVDGWVGGLCYAQIGFDDEK